MADSTYFAARDAKATASDVIYKVNAWSNNLEANGYLDKLRTAWSAYHGAFYTDMATGHQITFGGVEGELANFPVNHYRNLAQHVLVMTTSTRPVMEARSINTDYKSITQTLLANGLLDYYMREKRLEYYLKTAIEYAIVMGSGFIKMSWNSTNGELYDFNEETQTPIYEGDVEFVNLSPFDVVVDNTREDQNLDWIVCRTWKNRFDLAAKYPEIGDKLKALPTKSEIHRYRFIGLGENNTDDVALFEFFHRRTEALPEGRYLLFGSDDTVMYDGPLPYRSLPIFRVAPAEILGTPYGYTNMFDLLPMQEAINSLYSTVLSNQNAFGVQNIIVPRGADIAFNQLTGGLNIIEANTQVGKPEALQLTNTPPEIFNFINMIKSDMETLSGVNSVARGNPEASLKSGAALALVQSMAIQFMSGLQQSYVKLIEDVGTALILMLKDFAAVPRVAAIVGKNNRALMKEFKGEDLSSINRIVVDIGNPLARCLKIDTPIVMFDGSIKKVQDIVVGDLLMGPDSKPRTVESTATGQEQMYDIHHKTLKDKFIYGCNESHILSLTYCSDDKRYGLKKYQKVDISVKEFLSLPDRQQRLFMGYKTGVEFSKKETTIPPYILGLWLGDGHSDHPALTSMDDELVQTWSQYAESLGMKIRVHEQENNKSKIYHITSGESHGSSDRNFFMNYLRELNLIKNKHIPDNYKINDRRSRLELLAGFIDTDGSRIDEAFVVSQKSDRLTDDVEFLAGSLGFKVTRRKVSSDCGSTKDGTPRYIVGECNKLTITGETWEIPTKLPRKQAKIKKRRFDHKNYGIRIKSVGIGTYYGFTLREEPHFVLGDWTVTHNTTAGRVEMAQQLLQMGAIKDPQQYFTVMNTGRLDAMTEGIQSDLVLIKGENEMMMEGQAPQAIFADDHRQHIQEHRSVLSDPSLRLDANLVGNVLKHIQQHINLLQTTDPNILMALGQQPIQTPPGGSQPGGPPVTPLGGPVPPGGPQPPKGGIATQQGGMPAAANQAAQVIPGAAMPPPQKIPTPPKPFQHLSTNPAGNLK